MPSAVLVQGHATRWTAVLRFAGPVLLFGGTAVFTGAATLLGEQPTVGKLVAIAGMGVAMGGVLLLPVSWITALLHKKCWVQDTGEGFLVRERSVARKFDDEHVVGLAYFQEPTYTPGRQPAIERRCVVWLDGEGTPLDMRNRIAMGRADLLGPLITRLLDKLKTRAEKAIAVGLQASGEGWTLDAHGLNINGVAVPCTELAAAKVEDSRILVWQSSRADPIASIRTSGRNALVLYVLLQQKLKSPDSCYPTMIN